MTNPSDSHARLSAMQGTDELTHAEPGGQPSLSF